MRGHCSEEMATVLSNSIHAKEVDVKFVNKGLLERPGNLRKRFKGAEMHDTGTASLLDIPNALEIHFTCLERILCSDRQNRLLLLFYKSQHHFEKS